MDSGEVDPQSCSGRPRSNLQYTASFGRTRVDTTFMADSIAYNDASNEHAIVYAAPQPVGYGTSCFSNDYNQQQATSFFDSEFYDYHPTASHVTPRTEEPDISSIVSLVASLEARVYGAPISALAFDKTYDVIFVASATQPLSRGRFQHRASMLLAHSTRDGMLYSSVAAHPEAPPSVLKNLYQAIYTSGAIRSPQLPSVRRVIPKHAFRPQYGTSDAALPDSTTQTFQMGINQLLPLGDGYVSSVSPSAVRVHNCGGLQTADLHIEGMLSMTEHPNQGHLVTHLAVGGIVLENDVSKQAGQNNLICIDLWQGPRVVASHRVDPSWTATKDGPVAVTTLATSHTRGNVIAGSSDGQLRVFDIQLREVAKVKSHLGGVVDVAVSDDGNIFATVGYGSRGNSSPPMYAFPDPNVFCYDLRYLGRGAFSHSFSGLGGGPRHVAFLPATDGELNHPRLMVASGQVAGGIEIIVPFQETSPSVSKRFVVPRLEDGESITALSIQEGKVAIGTSKGQLMHYGVANYKKTSASSTMQGIFVPPESKGSYPHHVKGMPEACKPKKMLPLPSFDCTPELHLSPKNLAGAKGKVLTGTADATKSIFPCYILSHAPTLSPLKSDVEMNFGPLAAEPMIASSKNEVVESLIAGATKSTELVHSIPASKIQLETLKDHRLESHRFKATEALSNPNKLLYDPKLFKHVYKDSFNKFKTRFRRTVCDHDDDNEQANVLNIPQRYRLCLRPRHQTAAGFTHSEFNDTSLLPGWDYPPTMPNAFVSPVLLLLYFFPEARVAVQGSQFIDKAGLLGRKEGLMAELSFVFHRIECLAKYAMDFYSPNDEKKVKIGAWAPMNFVSCLGSMPEAEQLQILDGSPAAVDTPRRPEAFYRFMLYQIDKELGKGTNEKLMDKLCGVDFLNVNEFISHEISEPTTTTTRAMTVELYYEPFLARGNLPPDKAPSFGQVLYRTLFRETRLRAFNKSSGIYETIVQRKTVIALPKILSLSCACAGRREEDGIFIWRGRGLKQDHWLPETIEVEITSKGSIRVRELLRELNSGKEEWVTHGDDEGVSEAVATLVSKRKETVERKMRYRLSAVISYVCDDLDKTDREKLVHPKETDGCVGHHVLHALISSSDESRIVRSQLDAALHLISKPTHDISGVFPERSSDVIKERLKEAERRLDRRTGWILFNGFNVSQTTAEDARAFHVGFKEPCIVVFRSEAELSFPQARMIDEQTKVPTEMICTRSLTDNTKSHYAPNQKVSSLPGEGDLVAFDAEFVSVQEEVSKVTVSGSRVIIQEARHALARISLIACATKRVVFDDFVLPAEKVADYLTRFSGIVERDLNPKESERHLITTRAAYLKLRCLVERGCVFVGHGLERDFWMANLMVPASQIIDTVEIYHKPGHRYISLRFLTNYILKRDMQQEVHDSLEDATAALELYEVSLKLKKTGEFNKLLEEIYVYGQQVDWKLGLQEL